jgi:hypothetical protein
LVIGQQVDSDEGSRAFFGQLCYAARRWMQPQLQDVKGFFTDDDLPSRMNRRTDSARTAA